MRRRVPLLLLPLLAACTTEAEIAAEMERALVDTSQAMVGILLSAEVMSQVAAEPDVTLRHPGQECGCPCIEKLGSGASVVLTLDYALLGCLPQSLLLPAALSGHAVIQYDGDACDITWDQLLLGLEHPVSGELAGQAAGDAVSPRGTLTVGPWTADLALDISLDADALRIDGEVTGSLRGSEDEPRTVRFDNVRLPRGTILGTCPAPDDGEATLLHPTNEKNDVVVRFAHPGGGRVTVVRRDRVSAPTDWCGYTSPLW